MKWIVANWKMQLGHCAAVDLTKTLKKSLGKAKAQIVLCPSFTAIEAVGAVLDTSSLALGAQNVCAEMVGARTGEISPLHLGELGVQYVIVGHSERRAHGETDAEVNQKVISVLSAGMTPIICVGETKAQRKAGKTNAIVAAQVKAALKGLHTRHRERLIFAYEPVWAISSQAGSKPAIPSDVVPVHQMIRRTALAAIKGIKASQISVLYGGSVDAKNARAFLSEKEIDGALVGGASLDAVAFKRIVESL